MSVESRHLGDIAVLVPEVFEDERGFFMESYRADQFQELGLPIDFQQDNHSKSRKGVLRGLHFQYDPAMGKLMRVTRGAAYLVAVDIRKKSPTLGKWFGIEVTEANRKQVWAPAGFARGFVVLSDWAELQYKCTAVYNQKADISISWNDPQLGIAWPVKEPQISTRDANAIPFSQWLSMAESDLVR